VRIVGTEDRGADGDATHAETQQVRQVRAVDAADGEQRQPRSGSGSGDALRQQTVFVAFRARREAGTKAGIVGTVRARRSQLCEIVRADAEPQIAEKAAGSAGGHVFLSHVRSLHAGADGQRHVVVDDQGDASVAAQITTVFEAADVALLVAPLHYVDAASECRPEGPPRIGDAERRREQEVQTEVGEWHGMQPATRATLQGSVVAGRAPSEAKWRHRHAPATLRSVFADVFLPNLVIFVVGKLSAWGWLRTGMFWRGLFVMVALWLLTDLALLARFAYGEVGRGFTIPLVAMQGTALASAALFTLGRLRRRFGGARQHRRERFLEGMILYMRDDFDAARKVFARLRAFDPWDVPSTIALANVMLLQGRRRRAGALYRFARSLDVRREYADLLAESLERY
jgi:hypothetical protein